MFEKVNPAHPDKVADRIAGLIVDWCYAHTSDPRIAVEVMIGHGMCNIITESNIALNTKKLERSIINSIFEGKPMNFNWAQYPQDDHLKNNAFIGDRCGDNGIFKGVKINYEEQVLTDIVGDIYYKRVRTDGKYIFDNVGGKVIMCQSHIKGWDDTLDKIFNNYLITRPNVVLNPLGYWTGGTFVDTGATNRKLGSDMGRAITGGGLHGKDLSKADVTVNICAHLKAQETGIPIEVNCAIGDSHVYFDGESVEFAALQDKAREYIDRVGGFEKFAEWGLIRPSKGVEDHELHLSF